MYMAQVSKKEKEEGKDYLPGAIKKASEADKTSNKYNSFNIFSIMKVEEGGSLYAATPDY
jgi:hypothetical protein